MENPLGKQKTERHILVTEEIPLALKTTEKVNAGTEAQKHWVDYAQRTANRLDQQLFEIPVPAKFAGKILESFKIHEALVLGEEVLNEEEENKPEALGERKARTNALEIRHFTMADGHTITGYCKPRNGETTYRVDGKIVYQVSTIWDPATKTYHTEENPVVNQEETAAFLRYAKDIETEKTAIAEHYGVPPVVIPLSAERLSSRIGVEAGTSVLKEFAASRISDLLRLDVVPKTVLRKSDDGLDIRSIQKAVGKENAEIPAFTLDSREGQEVLRELRELGPSHPGAKSFMRIACLHSLIRSLDGSAGNIMYDPMTHEFWSIDNALSLGFTQDVTVDGQKHTRGVDRIVSLPLEIVWEHPKWELDKDALEYLTLIYKNTGEYLQRRETAKKAMKVTGDRTGVDVKQRDDLHRMENSGGEEIKFLTELFRFVYRNDKIAKKAGLEFFTGLKELLQFHKPKKLELGLDYYTMLEQSLPKQTREAA